MNTHVKFKTFCHLPVKNYSQNRWKFALSSDKKKSAVFLRRGVHRMQHKNWEFCCAFRTHRYMLDCTVLCLSDHIMNFTMPVTTSAELSTSIHPRNFCKPCKIGLPDIPYFTGAPVFQPQSPASQNEAAREMKSAVFKLGPLISHQYTDCTFYIEIHI